MVSKETFRQGMRRLGGAVTIVATGDVSEPAGLTATAVTSLSAEPPRLLACINRQGQTYDRLRDSMIMTVNVLGTKDKALAARFGGMDDTPEDQRFEAGAWQPSSHGSLYLTSALVSFICKVSEVHLSTTHGIAIGDISDIILGPDHGESALGYLNGQWAEFAPHD